MPSDHAQKAHPAPKSRVSRSRTTRARVEFRSRCSAPASVPASIAHASSGHAAAV